MQTDELSVPSDLQILFDEIRALFKRELIGVKRVFGSVRGCSSMCDENFP